MNAKEISRAYQARKSLIWLLERIDQGENSVRDMPTIPLLDMGGASGLSHIDRVQYNRIAFSGLRCVLEQDLKLIERQFEKANISLDEDEIIS